MEGNNSPKFGSRWVIGESSLWLFSYNRRVCARQTWLRRLKELPQAVQAKFEEFLNNIVCVHAWGLLILVTNHNYIR